MNYFAIPGLPREASPRNIIRRVCEHYNLTIYQLLSQNRHEPFVRARQMCYLLMREKIEKITTYRIANIMGGREHATVNHGIKKMRDLIKYDTQLRKDYETLKMRF